MNSDIQAVPCAMRLRCAFQQFCVGAVFACLSNRFSLDALMQILLKILYAQAHSETELAGPGWAMPGLAWLGPARLGWACTFGPRPSLGASEKLFKSILLVFLTGFS